MQVHAELALSPESQVYLNSTSHANETLTQDTFEKLSAFFTKNPALGLLQLGIQDFHSLPNSFLFWQKFSRQFLNQICKHPSLDLIPAPEESLLEDLVQQGMFLHGGEYLTNSGLTTIWLQLKQALDNELKETQHQVQDYLKLYNPHWNLVGRICFHLAENRKDTNKPFAFLATYTTQLSQQAVPQHLPLKQALQEYSGTQNHSALLTLLLPVHRAAESSVFIKSLVDSGVIFQASAWTAFEAHQFLKTIPLMESCGIMVRVPNWWNKQQPPRPQVIVKVGEAPKSMMGLDTLLDFNIHLALHNGELLSDEEWQKLLHSSESLVKIKETWVEVDRAKLEAVLSHWKKIEKNAKEGLTMAESIRLLAGGDKTALSSSENVEEAKAEWSTVHAGDWLKNILNQLRAPQHSLSNDIEKVLQTHLQGVLRPYQIAGVEWLWLLYRLKLGGCLADDMGLGKTVQILSLILLTKHLQSHKKAPHLLVVPASLLGNWTAEAKRFTPSLKIWVAHSSTDKTDELDQTQLTDIDIVLTTYGNVYRLDWLKRTQWNLIILDEAQFIKNPGTKQAKAVKTLKSEARLILTGTPIENRLGDLWSLFDFISPGLLGTSQDFSKYSKKSAKKDSTVHYMRFISTLRKLTQPYILRRLKSDKKIISDLPDKTEIQSYCALSKEQVSLYQQTVDELSKQLNEQEVDGIKRQGLVLSYLLRLKQICNHPTQWLGYGDYHKEHSGKFIRLQEICEEIAAKQEKVLVFTQFTEIIPALSQFLAHIFGREGLVLHGQTAIKKRAELVDFFQQDLGPPFFILSLKAGGTGLNLTKASHVIHFDRWWNPAVENQATDRAYRIGQKHPVLVHKFVCQGTLEEKIDDLIASKKKLSKDFESGEEIAITNLTNEQLLDLISLDIHKVLTD